MQQGTGEADVNKTPCPGCGSFDCRGACMANAYHHRDSFSEEPPTPKRPTMTLMMKQHYREIYGAVGIIALFLGSFALLTSIRWSAAPAPIVSAVPAWSDPDADACGQIIMALRPWPADPTKDDAANLGQAKYALDTAVEALHAGRLTIDQRRRLAADIRATLDRWPAVLRLGVEQDLAEMEPR
jgi:hypothetical protein